jgi:probable F420-dependent oxidoreductase
MRLGLALPHYDTSLGGHPVSWDSVARVATLAERSGFDSIWMSDHLFLDWGKYGGPTTPQGTLECWTSMSALAGVTERVRIGSMALCNDLRNPGLLAKMVASLDLLSGGRIDVGMGAGWYEPEYRAAGIEFDRPSRRIKRLGEAVEIVRRLLEGEELIFKGEHYTMDGAICRPLREDGRPPLWIGGKGDLLLRTAARVADGWNFSWIGSVDAYRERSRAADAACETAGRDPSTLRRSVGAYALVGSDEADLERRWKRLVERTPEGILPGLGKVPAVSWDAFRERGLAGTVAEVTDQIASLGELGVEEVILGLGVIPFQVADEEDVAFVGQELAEAVKRR